MRHLLTILAALILCATATAQTIRTLGYNSTNGVVVYGGANALRLTNELVFGPTNGDVTTITDQGLGFASTNTNTSTDVFTFEEAGADKLRQNARANLGFSTNLNTLWTATNASNARTAVGLGATWLTNTNVTNFRTAIGLGATNNVSFASVTCSNSGNFVNINSYALDGWNFNISFEERLVRIDGEPVFSWNGSENLTYVPFSFYTDSVASTTRTNLGIRLPALTNTSNVTVMRALAGSTNTNEPYSGTVALTNTNVLTFSNGVLLKIQ